MAACSSVNVVLGSRVKLAVRPSDEVTLIFLEVGFPEGGEVGDRDGVGWGRDGLFREP